VAKFKEVARMTVNDSRDIVMSQVVEDGEVKGVVINNYITADSYSGFAKGGVLIPSDKLIEFSEIVKAVLVS